MAEYRRDDYWNGHRSLTLTDAQARALAETLAVVLNNPTWPFRNSGEQRALGNVLENLHTLMIKRVRKTSAFKTPYPPVIGRVTTQEPQNTETLCDADWGNAMSSQKCILLTGHDDRHMDSSGRQFDVS